MERAEEVVDDNLPWAQYVFAVWNLIIRPPRMRYSQAELFARFPLGMMTVNGYKVRRTDFEVLNSRGLRLVCTLFEPVSDIPLAEKACVVYCHGNSSCRLGGFELVSIFMPLNISLVCFDFAGSGMSDGDYVSLGFHEQNDLESVIKHLRSNSGFSRIGVWGYSMGAATAIMHSAKDTSLAGVLLDSPFNDLGDLIQDICCHQLNLPEFLIHSMLPIVRLAIQKKALFDIADVSPSKHAPNCFVPALFLHGDDDDFIVPSHSSMLQSLYSGESMRLVMPSQTHASRRTKGYLQRGAVFFVRALRWENFLPPGITGNHLEDMARKHVSPGKTLQSKMPKGKDRNDIRNLLASDSADLRTLGLVRAACEVCRTYRGAELLPATVVSVGQSLGCAWAPLRYYGKVVLGGDDAEVAMCWSRKDDPDESCASGNGVSLDIVYFALVSPTAVSLTRVKLAPATSMDVGLSVEAAKTISSTRTRPFAGMTCVSVEPLAFSSVALAPQDQHPVTLRILEKGVVFSAGSAVVKHEERWPKQHAHIWCLHWKPQQLRTLIAPQTSLQLQCCVETEELDLACCPPSSETALPARLADDGASDGARLAKRLATLCFDQAAVNARLQELGMRESTEVDFDKIVTGASDASGRTHPDKFDVMGSLPKEVGLPAIAQSGYSLFPVAL